MRLYRDATRMQVLKPLLPLALNAHLAQRAQCALTSFSRRINRTVVCSPYQTDFFMSDYTTRAGTLEKVKFLLSRAALLSYSRNPALWTSALNYATYGIARDDYPRQAKRIKRVAAAGAVAVAAAGSLYGRRKRARDVAPMTPELKRQRRLQLQSNNPRWPYTGRRFNKKLYMAYRRKRRRYTRRRRSRTLHRSYSRNRGRVSFRAKSRDRVISRPQRPRARANARARPMVRVARRVTTRPNSKRRVTRKVITHRQSLYSYARRSLPFIFRP